MKRSAALIASAVAAVLASPALAAGNDFDQGMDEKCYGVSAKDMAACGAQGCASQTSGQQAATDGKGKIQTDDQGQSWGYVPKGTCIRMYGGTLFPKPSS